MRLVRDEDIPRAFAETFQEIGFEVIDIRDEGLRGASDDAVFDFAVKQGAILVTGDLGIANPFRFDLRRLAGIIVNRLSQTLSLAERRRELKRLLTSIDANLFLDHITILEAGKIRRRPIRG